jgi:hypothetical protein
MEEQHLREAAQAQAEEEAQRRQEAETRAREAIQRQQEAEAELERLRAQLANRQNESS